MTTNWRTQARCLDTDGDLFFPTSLRTAEGMAQAAHAKTWCAACPVRQACLEESLVEEGSKPVESRYGVRGGLTPNERVALRERRKRAARAAARQELAA